MLVGKFKQQNHQRKAQKFEKRGTQLTRKGHSGRASLVPPQPEAGTPGGTAVLPPCTSPQQSTKAP